jgi:hypothetical protein
MNLSGRFYNWKTASGTSDHFWDLFTLQLNFASHHQSVFRAEKGTQGGVWPGELLVVLSLVLRQPFPWYLDALSTKPRKWHLTIHTQDVLHSKKRRLRKHYTQTVGTFEGSLHRNELLKHLTQLSVFSDIFHSRSLIRFYIFFSHLK